MQDNTVKDFIGLLKKSRRGKLKIYIGMSAGVGKTYRMLQEAHALQRNGIGIQIGYIETHNRAETHALLDGLPVITRRKIFYKSKELEEMDLPLEVRLAWRAAKRKKLLQLEDKREEDVIEGEFQVVDKKKEKAWSPVDLYVG
ncbi:MAG: hypothetical protein V4577_11830, partial [Bacteroidota bacterium]